MTLEEIEQSISDESIYTFGKQQLTECLRTVAARDVGGNVNFHARLTNVRNFLHILLSDLDSKEQIKITKRTANTALTVSFISIAVSILLTVVNYCLSDKSARETTKQITEELQKIHKEEQLIREYLSPYAPTRNMSEGPDHTEIKPKKTLK